MEKIEITVCTPTYNRAYLLERPFNSLLNQTNKNFIWVIIDDGSTDNTKEIVQKFKEKAPFEIQYYYKENGGRHTALNYSYGVIKTKYVINLDSDDELIETCINELYHCWHSINSDDYERFWLISGRCINNIDGKLVGKLWPNGINELKGKKQRKKIAKIKGEKVNCRKLEVLRQFPFPIYEDTKFVTENTVWELVNREYDQYCVNNVFQKYYTDSSDGICNKGMHSETQRISQLHYSIFCLNNLFDELLYNKNVQKALINTSRCSFLSRTSFWKNIRELNKSYKKIIVIVLAPIGFSMTLFMKWRNK